MRNSKLFVLPALVLTLSGCGSAGDGGSVSVAPAESSAASPAAASAAPAGPVGRVTGTVLFEGAVPPPVRSAVKSFSECAIHHPAEVFTEDVIVKDGKLQNAFVYVKAGAEGKAVPQVAGSALLDQKGCIYAPHVSGVRVGQEVVIKNSDVTLHNVHSHSSSNKAFNVGMPVQGMKIKKSFSAPEIMVKLTCDVHPWMKSYIGVLPHPWFAVSAADGSFEIKDLPPGTYTLEAWHETFGVRTQDVTVSSESPQEVTFSFSA